ncbi:MAG: farnesyl diphosphate synthase [Pseudomonadales bacterium]
MPVTFTEFLLDCRRRTDHVLDTVLAQSDSPYTQQSSELPLAGIHQALRYSLLAGGKRVRPVMAYAAASATKNQTSANDLDYIAAAVECLHCYSLIHDDLPAMDDDDLRRGIPTCHIAFDEATAILAGDALQSKAFELLSKLNQTPATTVVAIIETLATASGSQGMVGGQYIDLKATGQRIDLEQLTGMHNLKTGALIRAAARMGALAGAANPHQLQAIDSAADAMGLAFQVVDDILDIESDTKTLGKKQGADNKLNKSTFPALLGMDASKNLAKSLHEQALAALIPLGPPAEHMRNLASYIIRREY